MAPVKDFIDTSQIKVPRQSGKYVKTELIKSLADGVKRACVPRMIADISRCGLYPEENMKSIWGLHWKPSRMAVLGVRVVELTSNPLFKENHLLPSLPILGMRIMTMLNGFVHEVFVKAYYNGKMDNDGDPMIEVSPIKVDDYLDWMTIRLLPFEVSAIGEEFFLSFKEAYK